MKFSGIYILFFNYVIGKIQQNMEFRNHVMTTTSQSSLYDCSAACVADMCCKSFNFFTSTLECQLNYKTKEESSQDFVTKKGSIYQDKNSIAKTVSGICDAGVCLSYQKCQVTSMNHAKCVSRDSDVKTSAIQPSTDHDPNVTRNCYDVMMSYHCSGRAVLTSSEVNNVTVFCDMSTLYGGWLIIQRRMDGSIDFYRTWQEYKEGFGDVEREFWLGNENIYKITSKQEYELRVDLEDFEGNKRYAMYSTFSLGSEAENYTLHIGYYSGNAGDSLSGHNAQSFTTKDKDQDTYSSNCAKLYHGAWWYTDCHSSNLNGLYLGGLTTVYAKGVTWNSWRGQYYSLKRTEIKIRPLLSGK